MMDLFERAKNRKFNGLLAEFAKRWTQNGFQPFSSVNLCFASQSAEQEMKGIDPQYRHWLTRTLGTGNFQRLPNIRPNGQAAYYGIILYVSAATATHYLSIP